MLFVFFFFSSRRRHTRWTGDWSSDVCSSDLTSPSAPRDIGPHLVLVPLREPAREGRAPLAPEPGQQGEAGPEPDHDARSRDGQPGERDGGDIAAERGPPEQHGLPVPEPASPPAPRHARHQRRPTSAGSSPREAPPPAASAGPRIATILLAFSANSAVSSARPSNLRRRRGEADRRGGGGAMAAGLLGRSIVPCTARVPPRPAPADEYDGGRVVRGITLGVALSAAAWAVLALALHTVPG